MDDTKESENTKILVVDESPITTSLIQDAIKTSQEIIKSEETELVPCSVKAVLDGMTLKEIGTNLMIFGEEFKVTFINDKKGTINIEPVGGVLDPKITEKQIFNYGHEWYMITYINRGKDRVTVKNKER